MIKNADVFKEKIFEKIIQIKLNNNKILQKDLDEIKRILDFHSIYENSKFTLIYKLDKYFNRIRIFGKKFVENNKNKCYIIIHNKKKELSEYYYYDFDGKKPTIGINLIIDQSIFDISEMCCECSSLLAFANTTNWDTKNVINMSKMFYKCTSLLSVYGISKLNVSKVTNMSYMFYECLKLSSLPDISIWNTSNVTDMSNMFLNCPNLSSLPDIFNRKI